VASSMTVFILTSLVDFPAWILVPFVPPLPTYAINSFMKKVRNDLGLKIGKQEEKSPKGIKQLLDILRERGIRNKLKAAYKTLARDHNSVSMCLYSGPLVSNSDEVYWDVMRPPLDYNFNAKRHQAEKHGWVGTGDLTFNIEHHLGAFKRHYINFSDRISTLLLPHHGSYYNFSHELGHYCSPKIAVTSTGTRNRFGHPHPVVLVTMRLVGSEIYQVTEKPASTFIEELHIER